MDTWQSKELSLPPNSPLYTLSDKFGDAVAHPGDAAKQCGGSLFKLARSIISGAQNAVQSARGILRCSGRRSSSPLSESLLHVDPAEDPERGGIHGLIPHEVEEQVRATHAANARAANDAIVDASEGCGCCTMLWRVIILSLRIWFLLKVFNTIVETSVGYFRTTLCAPLEITVGPTHIILDQH